MKGAGPGPSGCPAWRASARLVLALLALLPGGGNGADRFTAHVIGITDGDTLTILRGGRPQTVRLRGIDAPERGQPYATRARQHLAALAFGQTVTIETDGRDRYGRLVAEIRLPDGQSLNQELVRAGCAWWFRRYSADHTLARVEAEARAARRGLWADPHPVSPWDHRRTRAHPRALSGGRRPSGRPFARTGPLGRGFGQSSRRLVSIVLSQQSLV